VARNWKLTVYRSWDEVDDPAFLARWQKWMELSSDAHVFFHPVLVKAWTDTYRKLQNISPVYCVAEADGITVFLPLVLWQRNWKNAFLKLLVPAGYSDFDYHDPVVTVVFDRSLMISFWEMLQEKLLSGYDITYDKIEIDGLRDLSGFENIVETSDVCPFCNLHEFFCYDDFLKRLKKSLRGDLFRQQRRIQEQGEVEFVVFTYERIAEALKQLNVMLEFHSLRWPNSYKPPGLYQEILIRGLSSGLVHFSALHVNSQPVSWHLGFSYKGRFYYYMPSFVPDYAIYSPSKLHLARLSEDCFHNGIKIFDHLRGDENYKNGWASYRASIYVLRAERSALASVVRLTSQKFLQSLKV